ncbi:MAG: ABC transporter ATP-binding protein/permease [Actinomycetota bacterium]|nr:ABC transporter ATP-binding protein/permease [Actinomycetota bacterium]
MSDSDRSGTEVPTPPALKSMWRLIKLGYSREPGLLVFAVVVTVVSAIPDALLALWLKLLADGVVTHYRATVLAAVLGMAGSVTLTWVLNTVSTRMTRRFRDRVTIALETHVARLQASIGTVAHQERPEYLDRLSVLRNQIFVLDHMYLSVLSTLSWLIRLGVTLVLLATVHPLLILLALFALPTVVSASIRPTAERAVEEGAAVHQRLAAHLFSTATTASAGKEVRITGIGDDLVKARRVEWERWYSPVSRSRWITASWNAVAWAIFGLGFGAAVIFVAAGLHGTAGQVLLLLTAGARLSNYVSATVSEIGFLRGIWLDGARRLAWLEDYAAAVSAAGNQRAPETLATGIALHNVTFHYPGSDTPALQNASVLLPAGKVVALVGENGAGKSTLVKLLAKMYEPDAGRITVDGQQLSKIDTGGWRQKLAGAFQDFYRFEFTAGTSVGIGDLPRSGDQRAVLAAVSRAGADDVIAKLPLGLSSQLGPTWPDGAEVSFGQWQKLALARGFMRDSPLLLILDEPTAALDAETEHALFERYSGAARSQGNGGITLLVSHRFSTVRMADLIVVLDGAHIAEVGSHEELMRTGGPYSELYRIQQRAYR